MGYCLIVASAYLINFFPSFFSRVLIVLPLLSIVSLFLVLTGKDGLLPVFIAILFLLVAESLSEATPDTAIVKEDVSMLHGTVIQDSQQRSGRKSGFRIAADYACDAEGNVFSASGSIYVISAPADFYYGDEVNLWGNFREAVFYSYSSHLERRPALSAIRAMAVEKVKNIFRKYGDAGELASLLVLGTGSDGRFALTDDARQSGLSHVLALSGMHLAIIAAIIGKPLEYCLGHRRGRYTLTAVLFLFCFLSGWRASLMRAFIFRILFMMEAEIEDAFMLSMAFLYCIFPWSVVDIGGLLSFISLGGILFLSDELTKTLRSLLPLPHAFLLSAAASAAALLFSVPFTLSVFGGYQMWSIVTSYPFNLLISLYMVLSLFTVILPVLGNLLIPLYLLLEKAFAIAGQAELSTDLIAYLVFIVFVIIVVAVSRFLRSR